MKHMEASLKCFDNHRCLSQSEEGKYMWTHSKDSAQWLKALVFQLFFLGYWCSTAVSWPFLSLISTADVSNCAACSIHWHQFHSTGVLKSLSGWCHIFASLFNSFSIHSSRIPLVAPFINSVMTPSLSCIHKHLLSSDWESRPCLSKYFD